MFAILLSESMDPFYAVFLSFPTILFSGMLLLCTLFCLIAVLGLIDFDFLNIDIPDGGLNSGADDITSAHVLASLFMRLGLVGIPGPIILFSISLIGWMISFTVSHYLYPFIPDGILQWIVGLGLLFAVLYVSAYLTGVMLKPLKGIFEASNQEVQKEILGQVGIVRTSRVDSGFGEAAVEDGGAGLIVKVRSFKDETFSRGDRIVLLEHVKEENVYKVVSEAEFKGS